MAYLRCMVKIPVLPLTALGFYLLIIIMWNINLIPSPKELVDILEHLYQNYGLLGLVLATFFESIAYVCLYVPGAFIIALTVFFSDRSLASLVTISAIVAVTLTVTSLINYYLGRNLASRNFWDKKDLIKESEMLSKGLFVSMLHPNLLAFYFLNAGLEKRKLKQIIYVPLFMLPYGILVAYLLSVFSAPVRQGLESPTFLLVVILIWFAAAYWKESKKNFPWKKKLLGGN